MNDVFDDEPQDQKPAATESQGATQQEPVQQEPAADGGTPTPQDTEKHVPLAALEAERGQRKDWKEKALRYEGELKALREQQHRPADQAQPQEIDPIQASVMRAESLFLDQSERLAVKEHGKETVEKAFEKYQAEAQRNPALAYQMRNASDPYGEIVKWSKQRELMDEIGTDPSAYRAKLEAEIRASLQPRPPEAVIPASLAGVRSAGSRGTTWTGPPPLDSILQ